MDLFTPVVPEDRFHSNFRNLIQEKDPYVRDVIESWADGFPERDKKFVKEFQTTFNGCFWELYLYAAFRSLGFVIDLSYHAPDFVIDKQEATLCVEATIASHSVDSPPEWDHETKLGNLCKSVMSRFGEPLRKATI